MLVAQITNHYGIDLAEMPVPSLPEKGALVKVMGCGLCGSDLDKFIHQKASPGSVLGHEVVGIIEALDEGHPTGWRLGDRIMTSHHVPCGACHYCLNDSESMCREFKRTNIHPGGFSQYIALSEAHLRYTAFNIPQGVSLEEASCVEPLACVLRAIRRGGSAVNGSVAIVGLGFIGLMAAQIYQNEDQAVYGFDLEESRLALAKQHGFVVDAFHPVQDAERYTQLFNQHLPANKVDTVFLTAVNAKTIELSLSLLRDGGNLVIFTSASPGTTIDPSQLYFREINLITSYSPALRDLKQAAQTIFNRKINVAPLITHQLPLSNMEEAIELYRSGKAIKVFINTHDTEKQKTTS